MNRRVRIAGNCQKLSELLPNSADKLLINYEAYHIVQVQVKVPALHKQLPFISNNLLLRKIGFCRKFCSEAPLKLNQIIFFSDESLRREESFSG